MAQFRVEFVQDPASGKFSAELYHPDKADELIVRTEALYPVGSSRVDLQACKLEYSIVSPK